MEANENKLKKLLSDLNIHICPLCKHDEWSVGSTILELKEYHGNNLPPKKSAIFPVIPITCDYCGNTYFLNALVAGLIEPNSDGETEDGANESSKK